MKRNFVVKSTVVISIVCMLLLVFWSLFTSDHSSNLSDNVDEYIKVNKLNNKAIMVNMGYNAVIAINAKKGIVVIDAGISNSLTAKYRKIIEKEFNRKDFANLINTHSHWDHTGGNQVFRMRLL